MKSFSCILGVVLLLSVVELLEATSVSQFSCLKRNLAATVDNSLRLYIDGVEITGLPNGGNYGFADVVDLPCYTRLIAIHGNNVGSVGGILASTDDDYVLTNSSWRCSNVNHPGWEQIDFDDSAWVTPTEYGRNGEGVWGVISGISSNAVWIWFTQPTDPGPIDDNLYCRKRLDPSYCTSSPCLFGATCVDETSGGYCICVPGYTGQTCSVAINYCESSPCLNGATCEQLVNGYSCNCPSGYTGDSCQYIINYCESSPCANGGSCEPIFNGYNCHCPPGYTEDNCQDAINYCDSSPCVNGGTCAPILNGYACNCSIGYTGYNCQLVINYCESSPCGSGGSCLPIVNGYICQCHPGYTGDHCQDEINNCESFPCLNGGTCLSGINYFMCACPPQWTGVRCDTLLNPCDGILCANGGTCLNNCGVAQCICRPGWTGTLCLDYIDPCASSPCQNGGSCQEGESGWTCICPPSLTGLVCEQVIDLCASGPCLHGSTCIFDCGIHQCICRDGWTGDDCTSLIDACVPNPCLNGGNCSNLPSDAFACDCPVDWTGVRCESPNYDEAYACGTTLTWSQYNASNGFTRLCYFYAAVDDIQGRNTECRYTIDGLPLYDDYIGLLQAGGNFGCVVSQNYPEDLPITSQVACEDDYQQDVSLGDYPESDRIMVCIRYPYEGEPGRK